MSMRQTSGAGLKRRLKAGEPSGDIDCPLPAALENDPFPAVMSGGLQLLAELGRILDTWDTEFTRAAEEAQVRSIERN